MDIARLWVKLHAAHFASKSVGVRLVGVSASLSFLLLGIALILGTYKRWYKDRDLTIKRYPVPPYVLYFGETPTVIYGYTYGVACIVFGLALGYSLVL
jgi:hypothetical protein